MDCFVGIDLGSTTTKAVYMDGNAKILGRGITNSRCNYQLACQIAEEEARNNSRFVLLQREFESLAKRGIPKELLSALHGKFKLAEYNAQLKALHGECADVLSSWKSGDDSSFYKDVIDTIFEKMESVAAQSFIETPNQDNFFRDLSGNLFLSFAQEIISRRANVSFDRLIGVFDRAIIAVEARSFANSFSEYIDFASGEISAMKENHKFADPLLKATQFAKEQKFNIVKSIGTGYGRQQLPFPKERIRSEILCHGLGAHYMFPETRTVLDIGGQDTKAIQIDENGIVVNFQMNDRCAAGCGRYLGYVADEMNIGVHELGPQAMKASKTIRINSTCTVFAGSEIRSRLALGEKREEILSGLHRAIILRAMSLLARSGGIKNEFTFTGGVAKNIAATTVLKSLVRENFGNIKTNISADSIYTGACGAALFAIRDSGLAGE